MRSITLIISLTSLFLFLTLMAPVSPSAMNVLSVDDIVDGLTPAESLGTAPKTSKTRGFGGIRPADKPPSVILHVRFHKGSAELKPESVAQLQNLGQALQDDKLRPYVFRLEGHTCDLGSDALNMNLSRRRADAVKDYLVSTFSLSPSQLKTVGYGERKPLVENTNERARQQNRRVAVINTLQRFSGRVSSVPEVDVQIKYTRNNQEYTLQHGDTLTQRDNYAVWFTPKAKTHLYIYQVDTRGEMIPLFPNPEISDIRNPVEAGRLYQLPSPGQWFYLDANTGREHFIVMSKKAPLDEPDRMCKAILNGASPGAPSDDVMMASRERSGETKVRGLKGIRKDPAPAQAASAPAPSGGTQQSPSPMTPPEDMYVWRLSFNHR